MLFRSSTITESSVTRCFMRDHKLAPSARGGKVQHRLESLADIHMTGHSTRRLDCKERPWQVSPGASRREHFGECQRAPGSVFRFSFSANLMVMEWNRTAGFRSD